MEFSISFDNLDGFAKAEGDDDASPLVITATDEFSEETEKNFIAFNVQIGAKAARFLALKSDVVEFFGQLREGLWK